MFKYYISSFVLACAIAMGAYAQANNVSNVVIADVDLLSQRITTQVNRLFTIDISFINNIGTQEGIMYGVQAYATKDGARTLVDEMAIGEPLTLSQGQTVQKTFVYPLPQTVEGEIELEAFLKTDRNIPLSIKSLGKVNVEPVARSVVFDGCSVNAEAKTFTCTLVNTASTSQAVVMSTAVKGGTSTFAPLLTLLPLQEKTLTARERTSFTVPVEEYIFNKDAFFEASLISKDTGLLIERSQAIYRAINRVRSIDNVLIEQTSARDYALKLVSLQGGTPVSGRAFILSGDTLCAEQTFTLNEPIVDLVFALKQKCDTTSISVVTYKQDGSIAEARDIPHTNLFPQTIPWKSVAIVVMALILGAWVTIFIKRRNNK